MGRRSLNPHLLKTDAGNLPDTRVVGTHLWLKERNLGVFLMAPSWAGREDLVAKSPIRGLMVWQGTDLGPGCSKLESEGGFW